MGPTYKIYRNNNYVYIYDIDNDKLYQEHSFRVLVSKITNTGEMYNISFLRPETTPGAFYTVNWQQLIDETDSSFASQYDWEQWYQDNTGDIGVMLQSDGNWSCDNAQTTLICDKQFYYNATPNIRLEAGTTGSIGNSIFSISFASNGTAPALISFDSGTTFVPLAPGTSVNMDAGDLGWSYKENFFFWDTTAAGASLLITYNM